MRPNGLKQKLAEGRRVCGVLADVSSEDIVELFGHLGFDFAILDGQHGGLNPDRARALCRAGELTGMTSVVRVSDGDPAEILAYLDAGAAGIVVPNVATGAGAAAAASAMRYPPVGRRGAASRSRAAGWGLTQSAAEYYRAANDQVMLLALVEDAGALDHLADICGTPGVDVVFAGPGDLALSMGVPGGMRDPKVVAAVGRIRDAARAAGKPAMTLAVDPAEGRALYEQGFQGLVVGGTALLAGAARDCLARIGRS